MQRKRLNLNKEVLRILTAEETARVRGGLPRKTDPKYTQEAGGCTGLCGSGGCTSLIEECPVTMNCGL